MPSALAPSDFAQTSHSPLQDLSQQNPSAQNPLVHCVPAVQADPLGSGARQALLMQTSPREVPRLPPTPQPAAKSRRAAFAAIGTEATRSSKPKSRLAKASRTDLAAGFSRRSLK
jgi:hypothetical protein